VSRPTFASAEESAVWVQFAAGATAGVIEILSEDVAKTTGGPAADEAQSFRALIAHSAAKVADALFAEWRERCSR